MGVALYPVMEHDIPECAPGLTMSGKALASAVRGGKGELEHLCRRLGVVPIFDFYSESNEEAFGHIGEEVPPDLAPDEIHWSDPNEGLRTVDALLTCDEGDALGPAVREDLQVFRAILLKAVAHGTRFRLVLDV